MAMRTQRPKAKGPIRSKGSRISTNSANYCKYPQGTLKDDDGTIYSNRELTYVLSRHVIGNIAEVTTTGNEKLLGIIKAISPVGDMGLGYPYNPSCKNGHLNGTSHLVPLSDWKLVRIRNVELSDCLQVDNKLDTDAGNDTELSATNVDKDLVPFFASSDAPKDCFLGKGGFTVEEMYKTNKDLFAVSTTFNPELPEYKTPVDKSAPDYHETEARCAQLAREIEASESYQPDIDIVDNEDEEDVPIGRVGSKDSASKMTNHELRHNKRVSSDVQSDEVSKQLARVSLHPEKRATSIPKGKHGVVSAPVKPDAKPSNSFTHAEVSSASNGDTKPSTSPAMPPTVTTSEAKVKKSTLDPNAPLFLPLSMQTGVLSATSSNAAIQPSAPQLAFSSGVANMTVSQGLPTFVAAPQAQIYVPSTIAYGSHSGTIPHLMPAALAASVNSNAIQHMRVGSLPPTLHQQAFQTGVGPHHGLLMQTNQQGVPVSQVVSQPCMVSAPGNAQRFTNSALPRQNSTEISVANTQSSFGQSANAMMPTVQPPFYQLPPTAGGIPLWVTGAPQLGFNFVPSPGTSSGLMVSNIQLQQASGQHMYPAHAMVHVQPQLTMPTVPLESNQNTGQQGQHPLFQAHPQFSEHPMHMSQYAQGLMLTQPTGGFYPGAPILTGPGIINPAVRTNILPMLNQSAAHHPLPPGQHQSANMDQVAVNQTIPVSSFPQANCQPQSMQNFNTAHHILQSQHLASNGAQAMQPEVYQNYVALLARNFPSQAH